MKTYSDYLSSFFPGVKVQKISVDAGFTCPNRDGTISTGGCIYCRNDSFTPGYCNPKERIVEQLEKGKKFFSRKYPEMKYLAYFQSYTGTYNSNTEYLRSLYKEALGVKDIVGLVIATRPDCISEVTLEILSGINSEVPVFIELGAETSHDATLRRINRNHTWEDVVNATENINNFGLHCGLHLIAGLPGESKEDILKTVERAVSLPIETLKLHQLQVLKGTHLLEKLNRNEISIPEYSLDEYLNLCAEIIKIVPEKIIVERFLAQAPPEMVVYPKWGLKNYEFMTKLAKLIKQ
ncbi:MAG: TIGR01212 family radical SAM protein [Muribaculaceae bacterium]|nr:TIGR01212 family radical SAM protein [Muribaculaceae bacterium]